MKLSADAHAVSRRVGLSRDTPGLGVDLGSVPESLRPRASCLGFHTGDVEIMPVSRVTRDLVSERSTALHPVLGTSDAPHTGTVATVLTGMVDPSFLLLPPSGL